MSDVQTQHFHLNSNESNENQIKMRIQSSLSDEQLTRLNQLLNQFSDSDEDYEDQLPSSLNVKNVDFEVFNKGKVTDEFESLFQSFDSQVTFQYFRSFKMVRVNFSSCSLAAQARIQCHQRKIGNSIISCYFTQPVKKSASDNSMDTEHLRPPKPHKQFLISPPSSPPVGWEPCEEGTPVLDIELLNALSKLSPGQAHELHPPTEDHPAIVVHICEDQQQTIGVDQAEENQIEDLANSFGTKVKIQQTKRPPSYERSISEGSDESIDSC